MILIYSENITPRMEYICRILFETILQACYKIIKNENGAVNQIISDKDTIICYHSNMQTGNYLNIPSSGLLFETGIKNKNAEFDANLRKLFFDGIKWQV